MPFSTGHRACVGQSFARFSIFLSAIILLQVYTFIKPRDVVLTFEEEPNAVFMPAKAYKVKIQRD